MGCFTMVLGSLAHIGLEFKQAFYIWRKVKTTSDGKMCVGIALLCEDSFGIRL